MRHFRQIDRASGNTGVGTGAFARPVEQSSAAVSFAALLLLLALTSACRLDMHVQPRQNPLSYSDFYTDHRSARPPVEGTVARGELHEDAYFYTGKIGDSPGNVIWYGSAGKTIKASDRQRAPSNGP